MANENLDALRALYGEDKINDIDPEYLREIEAEEALSPRKVNSDSLKEVTKACRDAADLELDIQYLNERLNEAKESLRRLTHERIPALMEKVNIKDITIRGGGNLPDKKITLKTFCYANIAAGWDARRREQAFEALRATGDGGHLIKNTFTFKFPAGSESEARILAEFARKGGLEFEQIEAVHTQTLSKWLRERRKKGLPHPPLDVIGGSVGQEAVIKDV
jgi:hypothetical protein